MYHTTLRISHREGALGEASAQLAAHAALGLCRRDYTYDDCLQSKPGCGTVIVSVDHTRLPQLAHLIDAVTGDVGRVELYTTCDDYDVPGNVTVYSVTFNGYAVAEAQAA